MKMIQQKLFGGMVPLIVALSLAGCDEPATPGSEAAASVARPVKTIVVQAENLTVNRSYPATVLPSQQVELSFRVGGRIVKLPVRAAGSVAEGDIIAQLDKRDFEAEVERLESQIEQANAQLSALTSGARSEDIASLQAGVAAAQAQVDAASQQLDRTKKLYQNRVVARAKLDADTAEFEVAQAQLDAQKQELLKGQAGARAEEVAAQEAAIKGLQSQLKTAKDNLADTTLRAPFSGVIAKREVDNFVNIQPNTQVVVLQKLDTLDLVFDIPGPDVARYAGDDDLKTTAYLDALPGEGFEATLTEFSTQADTNTQTYRARVSITPPEGKTVLPGMSGRIEVTQSASASASGVNVPNSAISAEPDGSSFVWVVSGNNNTVSKRNVKTGTASGSSIAVVDGLQEGDVVVTAGTSFLQENMAVKPVSRIGD